MIKIIWKKEFVEILRTSKISWLFGIALSLMLLSVYNGSRYYQAHSRLLAESQKDSYQQFITQGDKNPHLGAHFGFYAYKPTADLAFIDNGIEEFTGNSFYLEPHKQGVVRFKEVDDSTGLRNFGFFNIGFFGQYIMPLFIFLLCHNVFSKEWENGTLKMLLSTNAHISQIFKGKLLACLTFIAAMLLATGVSTALSMLTVLKISSPDSWLATGIYFLGLSVFAFLLTVLSVTVSAFVKNSGLSLVVLSVFWLLGVFLIPRVGGEVSKHLYPSMTSLDFENSTFNLKQYGRPEEGSKDERRARLADSVMKEYHVSRLQDLPVYFIPITIEYFEDSDGEIMTDAYNAVLRNESLQNKTVLACSVFSPFLAFRNFSMAMSASDMSTHEDFTEKAEMHRRKAGVIINSFYQKNTVAGNDFWRTVPQFSYTEPGYGQRLKASAGALSVLLLWAAIALILLRFSYKHFTV